MSVGNAVGAVVGAVIGFYIGGPAGALKGAQLGMTIGGIVDPPKGPSINGPRLTDLTLQSSSYNAVIARTYGTTSLTGNIIWLENNQLKEVATKKKSGGKGGGGGSSVTTYAYYGTFACALCKGPITAVRRIWIGSNLVYDAGTDDLQGMIASNATASIMTVHTGTNTQLPDARMQATLGVANTPAYRGLAYIVFKDLALQPYGNTLMGAQIKVEVVKNGTLVSYGESIYTMPNNSTYMMRGIAWNGSVFCAVGDYSIQTSPDGKVWTARTPPVAYRVWSDIVWNGKYFCIISNGFTDCAISKDGISWITGSMPYVTYWNRLTWDGNYFIAMSAGITNKVIVSSNGLNWVTQTLPGAKYWSDIAYGNDITVLVGSDSLVCYRKGTLGDWNATYMNESGSKGWSGVASNGSIFVASLYNSNKIAISSNGRDWTYYSLPEVVYTTRIMYGNGLFYLSQGSLNKFWYSSDGITWMSFTSASMVSCYALAWNGGYVCALSSQNRNKAHLFKPLTLTIAQPQLGSIVSEECIKSGLLSAGDIDVTLLTQAVRGYRIGRISSLKTTLEPLQAAWPFDIIQSGYKLKFKPRGATSVVTIPAEDLAARQGE